MRIIVKEQEATMFALFVMAVISVYSALEVSTAGREQGPLEQASTRPDPLTSTQTDLVKPEQSWPPAGVFRPGGEVAPAKLIKDFAPHYTPAAMKASIQGSVFMEAVVLTDGSVGDVRVVRSLDKQHGLDEQSVKTVKEFRFTPGTRDGVPVPVIVEVQMSFTTRPAAGSRLATRRSY
jgi:TonB family protein